MAKEKFSFFESYYRSFDGLPTETVGEIVLAMGAYYFDDSEVELKGLAKNIFELIKPVMASSKEKSEKGSKGGAPQGNSNATKQAKTSEGNSNKKQAKTSEGNSNKKQAKTSEGNSNKKQAKTSDKDKEYGYRSMDMEEDGDSDTLKESDGCSNNDTEQERQGFLNPPIPPKKTASEIVKERNLDPALESKVLEWVQYKKEKREGYRETGLNALLTEIQTNVGRYGADAVIGLINTCMGRNYRGIIFEMLEKGSGDKRASPPYPNNITPFDANAYILSKINGG